MERVAFYCRTSTGRQEQDETIKTQIDRLNEAYKGKDIVEKYLDDGFSGSLLNRPALTKLKEDAKRGMFDMVAVYALDRFSRGGQGKLWFILDYLKDCGVKIEVMGKSLEVSTPEGALSTSVLASVAQYEKEKIKQRMVDGKYRKANAGTLVGCYPSWGYKLIKTNRDTKEPARLEIDPVDAYKVKQCFEIYAREQNLYKTSKILFEMGIYARGKKGEEGKNKVAILATSLRRILSNKNYIGIHYFGKRISCEADPKRFTKEFSKTRSRGGLTGTKYRPESEWKTIKIPAIIEKSLFDVVQKILARRRKDFYRETKYNYLLQKLIRCSHCGSYYRGLSSNVHYKKKDGSIKKYYSFLYICYKKFQTKKCQSKCVSGKNIEKDVWGKVYEFINNPEKIKQAVLESEKGKIANKTTNEGILNNLSERKKEIEKQISNLVEYISDGKIRKEDLYAKIDPLNSERELLESQIEKTKSDIGIIEESLYMDKMVRESCNAYQEAIDSQDFDLRKRIVRDWVKEVKIDNEGKIEINMRVPKIMGANNYFQLFPSLK